MKHTMKKHLMLIAVLFIFVTAAPGQPVHKEIVRAIEAGDSKTLSGYFHANLEMDILKKNYMVSKNHATRIIQDFFNQNPPTSFHVEFEGDRDDSRYAIGMLETRKGNFRVNLYFLSGERSHIIYYLSIEKVQL